MLFHYVTESEVNSSSSSTVSDAASTWAGWAVSAVASKFYKAQSSKTDDTSTGIQLKNTSTTGLNVQSTSDISDTSLEDRSRKSSMTSESSRNENLPVAFPRMVS